MFCSSACDLSHEKGFDNRNVARSQNPNRILIANLNISSLRNKFEILKKIITYKVDILLIYEKKLDSSFPFNLFHVQGLTNPYSLDRNQTREGIMLYMREDILSKSLAEKKLDNKLKTILLQSILDKKK